MLNRWLTKLGLIIAVLFIGACSSSTGIEETGNDASLQGRLKVWFSLPQSKLLETQVAQSQQVVSESFDRFTQLYPDIDIVLEWKRDRSVVEEFVQEVEKGLGPDIVYTIYSYLPPLIQGKVVRNLQPFLDELELFKLRADALNQVRYQGQIYGVPIDLDTQALCYNKEKIRELPQTLSDLRLQANQGYSVGIQSSFTATSWGIQAFGGQLLDAQGRISLTGLQSWAEWMEWLKTAKNEPNFILNEDAVALQKAFIAGRLTYVTCYSAQIPYLIEVLGNNRFGVTSLPDGENSPAGPNLNTHAFFFSSVSSPNQTQLALKLVKFLTNSQQQRFFSLELPGIIPVNQDVVIDRRLFPIQGIIQEESRTGIAIPLDERDKVNAIDYYGNALYSEVLAGEITPDTAADLLTDKINTQFGSQ